MAKGAEKKSAPAVALELPRSLVDQVQRAWGESPFYQSRLKGPAPDRFACHPVDPYQPDPEVGRALLAGRIAAGAEAIECEGELASAFRRAVRGGDAFRSLHRFEFLRPLSAQGARGRDAAQALARAWLTDHERWSPESWAVDLAGERLINICCHGAMLCAGSEPLWRSRILTSLARQTRHLAQSGHRAPDAHDRLTAALAIAIAGGCLPGCEEPLERGLEMLRRELRIQINADGGHIDRNPSRQLRLVIRLGMALEVLRARRLSAPGFLAHIHGRMAAHLGLFRLADGRLAVFNGGIEDDGAAVAAALTGIEAAETPVGFARQTGYQRLEAGRTTIVADTGRQTERDGYRGVGAFHLSSGESRIVANCGPGEHLPGGWRAALRQASAHSTLSADPDAALAEWLDEAVVGQRRAEDERGQLLEVSLSRKGGRSGKRSDPAPRTPVFARRLFLAVGGADLRGQDTLFAPPRWLAAGWRLRFHLHPSAKASLSRDGRSVLIACAHGEGWRFRTNCRRIAVEPSVYTGGGGSPSPSEQIVLSGGGLAEAGGEDMVIRWGFGRVDMR